MANTLFLLEDEINVASTLKARLELEGYTVLWAQSLSEGRSLLAKERSKISLALLDVNLPDGSGFNLAKEIRESTPSIALVFLTAAGTPEDRIHGLEMGAEDYVVKPFHFKELLLRIQNAIKRAQFVTQATATSEVKIGRARVFFNQYEVIATPENHPQGGKEEKTHLSHKECALLKLLYDRRGIVVSRDEILNFIWSEDEYPTPRTIDNFILRLRKLIEPDPESPSVIRSVRGVGYLLEKTE